MFDCKLKTFYPNYNIIQIMKFFIQLTILTFLLFLSGCTTQSAFKVFKTDTYSNAFNSVFDSTKVYQDTLQYTKKSDIINSKNEVDAILNVTYLNPTSSTWDNPNSHAFIIGIFIVNDNESLDKSFINNPEYKLTINNKKVKNIKAVDDKMNIRGSIPMENKWAKYYLVQISTKDFDIVSNKIVIQLSNTLGQKASVNFQPVL